MMPATCDDCGRPWEQLDGAHEMEDPDTGDFLGWFCSECWDRLDEEERRGG